MSYFGTREQAKSDSKAADMQIDSLDTTSPVRDGSSEAGGAPMGGPKEFSQSRTRTGNATGSALRREFPTEGASKK